MPFHEYFFVQKVIAVEMYCSNFLDRHPKIHVCDQRDEEVVKYCASKALIITLKYSNHILRGKFADIRCTIVTRVSKLTSTMSSLILKVFRKGE